MIARFLQDIVVNDIEKNMEMTIDKGEELFAIDRGTHYELRKADGCGSPYRWDKLCVEAMVEDKPIGA